MNLNKFPPEQRDAVYRATNERRDMRHFLPDPIDPDTLQQLLEAAHAAPSVGYMQPWRFVRITEPALRQSIHQLVSEERLATAQALGEQSEEFMRLKVEGILDCGELLVACLMENHWAPSRE
jgi:5,6-dimethylbenzimidazole synthase